MIWPYLGRAHAKKVVKLHLYCHNVWNTCPKWIKVVFLDSSCHMLSKNINFIWFLGGPKFDLKKSLWRHLANLHKFLYSFEKTIKSYWSMPNFKSISFKMAVLQGGRQKPDLSRNINCKYISSKCLKRCSCTIASLPCFAGCLCLGELGNVEG